MANVRGSGLGITLAPPRIWIGFVIDGDLNGHDFPVLLMLTHEWVKICFW